MRNSQVLVFSLSCNDVITFLRLETTAQFTMTINTCVTLLRFKFSVDNLGFLLLRHSFNACIEDVIRDGGVAPVDFKLSPLTNRVRAHLQNDITSPEYAKRRAFIGREIL